MRGLKMPLDVSPRPGPSFRRRLLLLAAVVVAGCLVGLLGQRLTGSPEWFLAVPAFLLVGWLFVANPTECLPPRERPSHNGPDSRSGT